LVIALTVNVLPEPVYPYAKHVTIPFSKILGKRSRIENTYISYEFSFSLNVLSNSKFVSLTNLVIPSTLNFGS